MSITQPASAQSEAGEPQPICVDCGEGFARSAAEIAARKGSGMPLSARCPACRDANRERRNRQVLDALRNNSVRITAPPAAGPEDAATRAYDATCSGCQRPIRLPFKPSLDRPVFCRFCFDTRHGR